jgi:hypothetical protein
VDSFAITPEPVHNGGQQLPDCQPCVVMRASGTSHDGSAPRSRQPLADTSNVLNLEAAGRRLR